MKIFTYATTRPWNLEPASPINSFLTGKVRSPKRSYKHKLAKRKGRK